MCSTLTTLDSFLPFFATTDTKMKLSIGAKLYTYLGDPSNSMECSDIGQLMDMLALWLQSCNFKVAQLSLEILIELVERMRVDFQAYLPTILPYMVDKLGDSKEVIREKTLFLLMKLMECQVTNAQYLLDKIAVSAFSHKNSNVREQMMVFLTVLLDEYGPSSISISKLVPHVVKLLSDPNSTVRSTAFNTLVSIYKHVGEKFRHDLQRKYSLPSNKLTPLMTALDQLKGVDQLCDQMDAVVTISHDQTDKSQSVVTGKICNGGGGGNTSNTPSLYKTTTKMTTTTLATPGSRKMLIPTPQAGAIDENVFIGAFEETTNWTSQQVYCGKDVEDFIKKAQEILSDSTQDWTKHVDVLRSIRCLMNTGGMDYDEFYTSLKLMLPAFHTSIRDLRSQVVRETCITLAYLSKRLASRFDYFAISLMDPLINLIQNSAKVISSCALICIRFILRYTHSPRLIAILVNNLTSKSKDIRRACCEFVGIVLLTWNVHTIEKQLSQLQNAIAKGVQDADPEARSFSRKAYATFAQHFPEQAAALLLSLDNSYKKLLVPTAATTPVAATPSFTSSNNQRDNNYYKTPPASASRYGKLPSRSANNVNNNLTLRSSSAIDLNAVKRAKVRAEYAALSRQKVGTLSVAGGCSLPRSKKLAVTRVATTGKGIGIIERTGRTKVRMSISQPTSRSASPLSKFGYTSGGDESETSSISGFDQSYEFRRRPSDVMYSWNGSQHTLLPLKDTAISSDIIRGGDITAIISSCENTYWTDRKKGLISLQCYLEDGYKIPTMADLKRIVDMFAKIFNDPHTKVFSIVLDSFNTLIVTHHDELHFSVQILLTRLLNKFGTDLLSSVQAKILSTLDLLCNYFPPNLQLHCVCRFLTDPTQTPNTRVKIATLKYLLKLTEAEQPCLTLDYSSGGGSSDNVVVINDRNKEHMIKAFEKLIGWTNLPDKELRKLAIRCLIAIFYQNIPLVTKLFSELPSSYQQMAANLIKTSNKNNYYNNYYYDNDTAASNTPDSSIAVSPPSSLSYKHYNCGGNDSAKFCSFDNNDDIITVDNDVTVIGGISSDTCKENNNNYYLSTSNDQPDSAMSTCNTLLSSSNDCSDSSLKKYIDELSSPSSSNDANVDQLWLKIDQIVRDGPSDVIVSNFKVLLRLILFTVSADSPESSEDSSSEAREMAINLLQTLVKRKSLLFCFKDFIELIILKVLKASRDNSKDVVKAAENCALTLSSCLPSDLVVRVIVPLIQADDYPLNLIAIKMITNIVQFAPNGKQPIINNISHIMNSLLLAYENVESSVRKSAVFSIVALHKELGGQLITPYINTLHGAKLKLLQLYIAKAQQNNNNNITNY